MSVWGQLMCRGESETQPSSLRPSEGQVRSWYVETISPLSKNGLANVLVGDDLKSTEDELRYCSEASLMKDHIDSNKFHLLKPYDPR